MFSMKVIHYAIHVLIVPSCSTDIIKGNKWLNFGFKLL